MHASTYIYILYYNNKYMFTLFLQNAKSHFKLSSLSYQTFENENHGSLVTN